MGYGKSRSSMINISFSSIGAFLRCPYSFYLCYVLKEKIRTTNAAMQLGIAIDDFLGGGKINLAGCSDETIGKARGLMKAISELRLGFSKERGYKSQVMFKKKIKSTQTDIQLIGFLDFHNKLRAELIELKTTTKPEWYEELFNIHDQVAMYLMAIAGIKHIRLATVRTPGMKMTKKFKSVNQFTRAVYEDVMERPNYYFKDIKSDGTFGKKFSIGMFDYTAAKKNVFYVRDNIDRCLEKGYWPKNKMACSNVAYSAFKCDYCDRCAGEANGKQDVNIVKEVKSENINVDT